MIVLILCLAMAVSFGGCKMPVPDEISGLVEDVKDTFTQPEEPDSYISEETATPSFDEPENAVAATDATEQTPSALVTDAYSDTVEDGEWFYC